MVADKIAALLSQPPVYPLVKIPARITGAVNVLQHDEAVVAAAHPQAPPQRWYDRRASRALGFAVPSVETVEMFEMAHLVLGDVPGQNCQHRIGAGAGQGRVIAGGACLDDAARGHFEAAPGLERGIAKRPELLNKALEGGLPVEFRPCRFDIAAQRPAVLQLLRQPITLQPR